MFNFSKNFREASLWLSLPPRTISRCIRNLHVLKNSRKRHGGQVESWQGSQSSILVKISGKLLYDCLSHLGPSHVHQEPPSPPRLQEETWMTGGVLTGFLMFNRSENFREAYLWLSLPSRTISCASGTSKSSKTPGRDLNDRWSLDRVPDVQLKWKFQGSFSMIVSLIHGHLQMRQEPPCPPKLLTWL